MSVRNVLKPYRLGMPAGILVVGLTLAPLVLAQTSGIPSTPAAAAKPAEQPSVFPQGLPKLEQFLSVALERHPDVVVARSKVEAARAELLKTEATAMKELLQLHQRTLAQRASLDISRKLPGGGVNPREISAAASELGLLEWEVALSMGFHSGGKLPGTDVSPKANGESAPTAAPTYADIAFPKRELAAKLKEALNQQIDITLTKAPLSDLCAALTDKVGIPFIMNKASLEDMGFATDAEEFEIAAKGLSVTSVLQQIQDQKSIIFIVRDYGILVCVENPGDGILARDFATLTEDEIREKHRAHQAELIRRVQQGMSGGMGGMGGGMGGGGGFF